MYPFLVGCAKPNCAPIPTRRQRATGLEWRLCAQRPLRRGAGRRAQIRRETERPEEGRSGRH